MIVEHDGRRYPLGRLNDVPHDPENRRYPAATAAGPWRRVRWVRNGPPLDQGNIGSCTGNALAGWFNTDPIYRPGQPLKTQEHAQAYYSAATRLDRIRGVWPPTDTGSTGPAVCKAARNRGDLTGWHHAFGIDHLLGALMLGPAMVGTVWLLGMFGPDPRGLVTPSGDVVGGHEYLATEFDPDADLIGFDQSWGDWGVGGRFFMRRVDVAALLREGGDVTVPQR